MPLLERKEEVRHHAQQYDEKNQVIDRPGGGQFFDKGFSCCGPRDCRVRNQWLERSCDLRPDVVDKLLKGSAGRDTEEKPDHKSRKPVEFVRVNEVVEQSRE